MFNIVLIYASVINIKNGGSNGLITGPAFLGFSMPKGMGIRPAHSNIHANSVNFGTNHNQA